MECDGYVMKTLNRTEAFQKVPFPHPQRASQWALMFINTGRCFQNAEKRFRDIGFNG